MRGGEKDRRRRIDEERSREGEVVGRRGCGEEGSWGGREDERWKREDERRGKRGRGIGNEVRGRGVE